MVERSAVGDAPHSHRGVVLATARIPASPPRNAPIGKAAGGAFPAAAVGFCPPSLATAVTIQQKRLGSVERPGPFSFGVLRFLRGPPGGSPCPSGHRPVAGRTLATQNTS